MATTQVSITYGGKELDCELSFTPQYKLSPHIYSYNPNDCEFTLEKVYIVCKLQLNFDGKKLMEVTHLEDITPLLNCIDLIWNDVEEIAIAAIMERGYV